MFVISLLTLNHLSRNDSFTGLTRVSISLMVTRRISFENILPVISIVGVLMTCSSFGESMMRICCVVAPDRGVLDKVQELFIDTELEPVLFCINVSSNWVPFFIIKRGFSLIDSPISPARLERDVFGFARSDFDTIIFFPATTV
jgi:hypothetical protein